jgi:ribonuclease J
VPVHGEARHLIEHARFARSLQVPEAPVVENGDVLRLAPGPAEVVDQVPYGRLIADGRAVVNASSPVIKTRRRMMYNGVLLVTLVLDADGRLATEPKVRACGVFHPETDDAGEEEDAEALAEVAEVVRKAVAPLPRRALRDDVVLEEAVRTAARRHIRTTLDKRPVIETQIVRL